jgi:hypothetical protein
MYVAEMHKQKWEFGEEFQNAEVTYASHLHIFVYTSRLHGSGNLESTLGEVLGKPSGRQSQGKSCKKTLTLGLPSSE